MRRLLLLLLLAALPVACGGEEAAAPGAEFAPADVAVYAFLSTDLDSEEWQRAGALLDRFPGRQRLVDELLRELEQDGLTWEEDIRPALGESLHLVLLDYEDGGENLVGFAQPRDQERFRRVLEAGEEPQVWREVEGWTVFAQTEAQLDRFEQARGRGTLAEDEEYAAAVEKLPDGALAHAFFSGQAITDVLPEAQMEEASVEWVFAALVPEENGVRLAGTVRQTVSPELRTEAAAADLLAHVPGDVLAAVSFQATQGQLELGFRGAGAPFEEFEDLTGIALDDLARLFDGEGMLYVRTGFPIPEATLLLEGADDADLEALETLAGRIARLVGATVTDAEVGGSTVRRLALGPVEVLFGRVDERIVVSTSRNAFGDLEGGSLAEDERFRAAAEAAGMPDETYGFLYVDLEGTLAAVQSLAALGEEPLPREIEENLEPLTTLLVYSSGEPEESDFSAFLEIR